MRTVNAIAIAVTLLGLAACSEPGQPGPGFGEAVRNNMAAQIIPPPLRAEPYEPTDLNGARAEDAFTRYETGKVTQPATTATTTTGATGGGGAK